jgi:hypothetical protein
MKEVYLDGTKIEANASRYLFVWGKSIKTSKKRIENQLKELWKYACGVARQEMKDTEPLHFEQIEGFVKFNYFHLEQQDKFHEDPSKQENLHYNVAQDCFYCPMGQKMANIGTVTKLSDNGYVHTYTQYQAKNCQGCPMRGVCNDQKSNSLSENKQKN